MIGRLRGTVAEVGGDHLIVDVAGVGYLVSVPGRTAETTKRETPVTLAIHTAVREDAITLYGFTSNAEKECFEQLLTVAGVGPRIALSALSALSAEALAMAVNTGDVRTLSSVSGIGKKTAERMILELRGKLAVAISTATAPDDALPLALGRLGYKPAEIDLALSGLMEKGLQTAALPQRLSEALRILSSGTSR